MQSAVSKRFEERPEVSTLGQALTALYCVDTQPAILKEESKQSLNANIHNVVALFSSDESSPKNLLSLTARNKLITKYRPVAKKLALGFLRSWRAHMDADELQSLLDLAVCQTAFKFRPGRGAKFTTLLHYYIRGSLIRAMSKSKRNRLVYVEEFEHLASLNPISDGTETRPDKLVERNELQSLAHKALASLGSLERAIIEKVYFHEQPVTSVAKDLGYSRSHVSRVRNAAMAKMRRSVLRGAHSAALV